MLDQCTLLPRLGRIVDRPRAREDPWFVTRHVHLDHGPRLGGASRLARTEGVLCVDEDGCAYVGGPGRRASGLIWPMGYEARVGADGLIEIVDPQGEVVVREGERFAAGGGVAPDDRRETRHASELHGRGVFFIQHAPSRLD